MHFAYLEECYKHRWLLDYVTMQVDKLSYRVTNTDKLENRIYLYIGKYLLEDSENHENRSYIKRLVMKKIKESLPRFAGAESDQLAGLAENEEGATNDDCCSNQQEQRLVVNAWSETLAGDSPKHKAIVLALAKGYTFTETAELLTDIFGGKMNGSMTCIKRFRANCRKNKTIIFDSIYS